MLYKKHTVLIEGLGSLFLSQFKRQFITLIVRCTVYSVLWDILEALRQLNMSTNEFRSVFWMLCMSCAKKRILSGKHVVNNWTVCCVIKIPLRLQNPWTWLLLEPGLLGPKTVNASNIHTIVAKCISNWKLKREIKRLEAIFTMPLCV